MAKNIVAMVPARVGSEGLKNKNIRPLRGLPLLAHSLKPALKCDHVSATYLNSDSPDYLNIGASFGAKTYRRPDHLGNADTTMQAVVSDFVTTLRGRGEAVDAVLVLYPTYPFRTPELLSDIVDHYLAHEECHSVIGLKKPETHPFLCVTRADDGSISNFIDYDIDKYYRRQDYPSCYQITAWALVVKADHVDSLNAQLLSNKTFGFVVPDSVRVVDIDTSLEFQFAEFLLEKGYL